MLLDPRQSAPEHRTGHISVKQHCPSRNRTDRPRERTASGATPYPLEADAVSSA
jgi:hypothetical protein